MIIALALATPSYYYLICPFCGEVHRTEYNNKGQFTCDLTQITLNDYQVGITCASIGLDFDVKESNTTIRKMYLSKARNIVHKYFNFDLNKEIR